MAFGLAFEWKGYRYKTTGEQIGTGGGAIVVGAQRRPLGKTAAPFENVVLRIPTRQAQARASRAPVARRMHEQSWQVGQLLESLSHHHVMSNLLTARISDTWIVARHRFGTDLREYVFGGACTTLRDCMRLFLQALDGLAFLHKHEVVHGDFTPQNVALLPCGDGSLRAAVFDYDLSLGMDFLPAGRKTYRDYFEGTRVGTPGFSMLPEFVRSDLQGQPSSQRGDVYAAGAHIYYLLTGESVLGPIEESDHIEAMSRIGHDGAPPLMGLVPTRLRPIIARCLLPDPSRRYADASQVLQEICAAARSGWEGKPATSRFTTVPTDPESVFRSRPDQSLTRDVFDRAARGIARYGYQLVRCLHRVRGHGAFIASPDPILVASGRFPERNPFKKVVSAIDLGGMSEQERQGFLRDWTEEILPIVGSVRQRHLTTLYMAEYDAETRQMLLFTEYLSKARFGQDLLKLEPHLSHVLALALELASPLRELHDQGIAHSNVGIATVMFKADRETETARPILAGLVEPSLDQSRCQEDVRQYARLVTVLLGRADCTSLQPEIEQMAQTLTDNLLTIAEEDSIAPAIDWVTEPVARVLAGLDPDFASVARGDGELSDYLASGLHPVLYSLLFRPEA